MREVAEATVRIGFDHGRADVAEQAARVGDHQMTAGPQDTDELG